MIRLRVHHLLCSALYVGKGYSNAFCTNMNKVVQWLWNGNENNLEILLTTKPDEICRECPNLTDNACKLDGNDVVSKDEVLARELGLETERTYTVADLLHTVSEKLASEIFENSCRNCDWYRQGLCDYDKLSQKYKGK